MSLSSPRPSLGPPRPPFGALLLALLALAGTVAPVDAGNAPPPEVVRLARASVDARFVPAPADSSLDLVTGEAREELERQALEYYGAIWQADPDRFRRMEQRVLGRATAAELHSHAVAELAAGRPVAAELAWSRVVEDHPESPNAGPALLHRASSRLRAGRRHQAASDLARLPELDLRAASEAAPLMARLLSELEADLEREGGGVTGKDKVRLHRSLERLGLDRARELAEWTSGWSLSDEVARTLRLETSGDVLRRVKNLGADALKLNALVELIPHEERVQALVDEAMLSDPTNPEAAGELRERLEKEDLDRLEDLARLQRLQVVLLARAMGSMVLEDPARRLGEATLERRRALAARLERLGRHPEGGASAEEVAVGRLVRLSDVNGDGRITPLHDDEGFWRPKRPAVEGDMRNAIEKPLDDDNPRAIADLFERTGLSEKALLMALVRATLGPDEGETASPRVAPGRVDELIARLGERGRPAWEAANPRRRARGFDVEVDYLARLNVLRRPGEGLDDVLRREVLEPPELPRTGAGALASDPRAQGLLVELASLGHRWQGAWVFEDDLEPRPDGSLLSAEQKLVRAQELRAELDAISASRALDSLGRALVADLEAQGLRFRPEDREEVLRRVRHEDLGTLAFVFDELGDFSHLQDAFALTTPGTRLGELGPGHLAYGFGLDLKEGVPAGNVGWRGGRELNEGRASLRYHVGATGLAGGLADTAGAAARFRQREVWQPEIGADASALRGLAGRGFFNLIRDVNVKHRRKLAAIFEEHEKAKARGRQAFIDSLLEPGAEARPAVLFMESLGRSEADMRHDEETFLLLHDAYEHEKARRRSVLNRESWKVRFAGLGVTAAFFAGDVYLLAGPKLAFKDFRLFSRFIEGAERRVQSEEAENRRVPVPSGPTIARAERRVARVDLEPVLDERGLGRFRRTATAARVEPVELPRAPVGVADWPADVGGERRTRTARRTQAPAPRLASFGDVRDAGIEPPRAEERWHGAEDARGAARADAAEPDDERARAVLDRLNAALRRRGVPLEVRPTTSPQVHELAPRGLTPWAAQSLELFVASDEGLGLAISPEGRPLLVCPASLDGVVLDWMEEVRSVTRPGEADEVHRVCFSRAPGRRAVDVIESSAWLLRTEVVDGEVVGTARLATRYRDDDGEPFEQANVIAPEDSDAAQRIASVRAAAARQPPARLPDLPAVALRRPAPAGPAGTLSDPEALDPRFLRELRHASRQDLASLKRASIEHATDVSRGGGAGLVDPRALAWIQERSLAVHGRPLAGAALEHAHFVLTHEGLYRADGGPVARQVAHLEARAVTPWGRGREFQGAPDARTRRLMRLAGVDEAAARSAIQGRVSRLVTDARASGRLRRDVVPEGTRIVTASQAGERRGLQWTVATEPVEAHLVEPLDLFSDEGRYVAALALGADIEALDAALRDELEARGELERHRYDLDADLVPALARALAAPAGATRLIANVGDVELEVRLDEEPAAGALARCKNATLFLPPYRARMETSRDVILASGPATLVGTAEADNRFIGESWAGWRRLEMLLGAPLGGRGGSKPEPEPEPDPDPQPIVPPREGTIPPAHQRGRVDPPSRPPGKPDPGPPPRTGNRPPAGPGRGSPEPPGRPVPEPVPPTPPRDGVDPPPNPPGGRPTPPDPPDRPRRPVD